MSGVKTSYFNQEGKDLTKQNEKYIQEAETLISSIRNKTFTKNGNVYECYELKAESEQNVKEYLEKVNRSFNGKLNEVIDKQTVVLDGTVPIMSMKLYMAEIEEKILNGNLTPESLSRYFVNFENGCKVGNVIIYDKGTYYVINELYREGVCILIKYYKFDEINRMYNTQKGNKNV